MMMKGKSVLFPNNLKEPIDLLKAEVQRNPLRMMSCSENPIKIDSITPDYYLKNINISTPGVDPP
jgi:hypothetical protein